MVEYRFDFDDAIPDLPEAFDLDEVSRIFEDRLFNPNPNEPRQQVRARRMQDLKYQPLRRCVTTYELEIEPPDAPDWQTIGVLEFNSEGVVPRIYAADPKMSELSMAIDEQGMQARFAEALGEPLDQVDIIKITPVRYKPGLHCVFRYHVHVRGEERVYYSKLFAEPSGQLVDNIRVLHHASLEDASMPRVPEPVAYWPELNMLVQPAVTRGVEFTKYIYNPAEDSTVRVEWMRQAGRTLSAMHHCKVPGPTRTLQDDLRDLEEYLAAMEKVKPGLAARFEKAIQAIIARVGGWQEPEMVPSHGAMRTDQFIIQDDRLAVIDLDGFCWSNPARDLGNFLAYLCWKAIRQPEHGSFVEAAGRSFLDGYMDTSHTIDARWLSIYQAASLLKIAGRRFRNLNFKEWPLVIHLIEAAEASLNRDFSQMDCCSSDDLQGTLVALLTTSTEMTKFPATFIDREFPALWGALNAEMMTDDLRPVLQGQSCNGQAPCVQHVRLLAYKPGKRGVIRYELEGMDCHPSNVVLGKIYPQPEYSERAYRVMETLWKDIFASTPELGVPQPLGFIPQLSMLVFVPNEGQFLSEVIASNRLDSPITERIMDLAGAWLARLHTHPLPLEKVFAIEGEYDNIHDWAELISEKYPEERPAVEQIASYLLERAPLLKFDNTVPIHKDFHYEHILLDGGLKVFDFDEIRLGDPNIDLSHFCANFYLLAYRNHKHTAQFSKLQNRFFDAYARETGWQLDERFLFFYAYTCLKIAKQLCKKRGPRPWPEGEEQHAQVWLMLEQGLTTVSQARATQFAANSELPLVEFSRIRRSGWTKAGRISKSDTSSAATHVSHRLLS